LKPTAKPKHENMSDAFPTENGLEQGDALHIFISVKLYSRICQ